MVEFFLFSHEHYIKPKHAVDFTKSTSERLEVPGTAGDILDLNSPYFVVVVVN